MTMFYTVFPSTSKLCNTLLNSLKAPRTPRRDGQPESFQVVIIKRQYSHPAHSAHTVPDTIQMKQLTVHYQELLDPLQVRSRRTAAAVSPQSLSSPESVVTLSRIFPYEIIFQKRGIGIWLMLVRIQKLILSQLLQIQRQHGLQLLCVPMISLVLVLSKPQSISSRPSQGLPDTVNVIVEVHEPQIIMITSGQP